MTVLRSYREYVDTGVEWVGELPRTWTREPLKRSTYIKARVGWKGLTSDEFEEESYAYLVTGSDFTSRYIDWSKSYQVSQMRYEDDPFIQLADGDLLVTKDGTIGKLAIVAGLDKPACLNSGIFVVRPTRAYTSEYLYWVLSSSVFRTFFDLTSFGSTIMHLYQNVFENFILPVPSTGEQRQIVEYLDRETAEIDAFIADQERLIGLLAERRAATISHAVTKGLDPTVPMKDSGVEWIGEVPNHWSLVRSRFLCEVKTGSGDSVDAAEEGEYPFYVRSDVPLRSHEYEFEKEAVLTAGDGAGVGKVFHLVSGKFAAHQRVYVLTSFRQVTARYFYYFFSSMFAKVALDGSAKSTVDSVRRSMITELFVSFPDLREQEKITAHIDAQAGVFDSMIEDAKKAIALSRERRAALISAAVTGKIDVREDGAVA